VICLFSWHQEVVPCANLCSPCAPEPRTRGTPKKLPSGSYRVQIRIKGHPKVDQVFPTKKAADDFIQEVLEHRAAFRCWISSIWRLPVLAIAALIQTSESLPR
jgi:hypothetical protein